MIFDESRGFTRGGVEANFGGVQALFRIGRRDGRA